MSVFRFRVYWEEDDLIYRDVEILSSHTFLQLHEAILKSYDFDTRHAGSFYECNDRWLRNGRELSSEVATNKKDAPALSMARTPVAALVSVPDQHFLYDYDRVKKWSFLVELVGIEKDQNEKRTYPTTTRKEGIAPPQYGAAGLAGLATERAMVVEEAYDLGAEEMAEGFGSEGDGAAADGEESYAADSSSDSSYDE